MFSWVQSSSERLLKVLSHSLMYGCVLKKPWNRSEYLKTPENLQEPFIPPENTPGHLRMLYSSLNLGTSENDQERI